MPKVIFDLIQRFEVENGVPRLVSTKTQVIEGGEDLLSLATSLLTQLGLYEKFEEKRKSQYIGYRLKNPRKGDKRYQLVLAQRKESLYISIDESILSPKLLNFGTVYVETRAFWVRPSKMDTFLTISNEYKKTLGSQSIVILQVTKPYSRRADFPQSVGWFHPQIYPNYPNPQSVLIDENDSGESSAYYSDYESYITRLSSSDCCLEFKQDTLFPYALQSSISSREVLEELIENIVKILMEQ